MVNVPSQYQSLLQDMSSATGIPYNVEAAQAQAESNFSPTATSPTGAEGWLQFEPATYSTYASQVGVAANSEFDPASEEKVYVAFMDDLLKQEKGNLRDALAAYNAGPGNLSAGYGYADAILQEAGVPANTTVKPGTQTTQAQTTGLINLNPFSGISISGVTQGIVNSILSMLGLGSLKDMLERAALIVLGFALLIIGIHMLSEGGGGGGGTTTAPNSSSSEANTEEGTTSTSSEGRHRAVGGEKHSSGYVGKHSKLGVEEAAEAAAVA